MNDDEDMPRRLDKWLRDATRWSRSAVAQAIEAGRVKVDVEDETAAVAPEQLVFAGDRVLVDDTRVSPRGGHTTVLFHKPSGVTTTTADPDRHEDLSALIMRLPVGCQPVGRLDRLTTGALLLSTDGDLANALLKPTNHCPKRYRLIVERLAGNDPRLTHMRSGVETSIGELTVHRIVVVASSATTTTLSATLHGGKNRQLRRMCYAAGLRLHALHREAIGPTSLGGLPLGAWRSLASDEVEALWQGVGGQAYIRARQRGALLRRAREARERGHPLARLEAWLGRH